MQYAEVDLLATIHNMAKIVLLTILINLRYAMYGLSLIECFRGVKLWKKLYLILTLTDETYALQVENRVPIGEDSRDYCFLIAMLNHIYWICGGIIGMFVGSFI